VKWPYAPIEFTTRGTVADDAQLDRALQLVRAGRGGAATDVLLLAHGWNNDIADAERLFTELADNTADLARTRAPDRRWTVIGLLWPSVKWADDGQLAGGGLSTADELSTLLDAITERVQDAAVAAELRQLAGDLDTSREARDRFLARLRDLLPAETEVEDDDPVPGALRSGDTEEVFAQAHEAELAIEDDAEPAGAPGDADLPPGLHPDFPTGAGPAAAGLSLPDLDPKRLARQLLNLTTYYTMKARAGSVGSTGVAGLLGRLAEEPDPPRLHLAGHSFGARVVSAAASGTQAPVASVTLLQGAFSHRGFSGSTIPEGAFRRMLTGPQLLGPVVVTHTHNDRAVRLAYAVASRLARQVGTGLGDAGDPYGGLGANGAVATVEVDTDVLGDEGARYRFAPRRITNLRADRFVANHGDVRNPAVANALLQAMLTGPVGTPRRAPDDEAASPAPVPQGGAGS
jgi:esterase/lipase superfamily enzyme